MKTVSKLLSVVLVLSCASLFGARPKYVFLFIGDGMSTPQRMVAEEFAAAVGHGEFAMNRLPYQANTRTKSANAVITDSAAAGTAIACGAKTCNGRVGVDADGNRLESVAEAAKKAGMKVGIVTTVTIVHATPACFYAHNKNRGASYQIALDLIASGFDYFAASGVYDKYDLKDDPQYRGNVFDLARQAGYAVNRGDKAAWAALGPGSKSWNVFGDFGMQFAIDADGSEPTLAELVEKGIEILENPKGFFVMCEGGKVDYGAHANDAATTLHDVLALDEAVKVALAFQAKHPDDTLVVTTGDHETGGMSMGFAGIGGKFRVEKLATQKVSTEQFSKEVKKLIADRRGNVDLADLKPDLAKRFGLADLTKQEADLLKKALQKDIGFVKARLKDTTAHDVRRRYVFAQAVKNVLNARAGVGWSSSSHTALPTLTTAMGAGAEMLVGMTENSDLGTRLKALLR